MTNTDDKQVPECDSDEEERAAPDTIWKNGMPVFKAPQNAAAFGLEDVQWVQDEA